MRKRSTGINIRVPPTEKRKMERRARNTGLTLSEYLRQRALRYTPKFHLLPEFFSELVHLKALTEQNREVCSRNSRSISGRVGSDSGDGIVERGRR